MVETIVSLATVLIGYAIIIINVYTKIQTRFIQSEMAIAEVKRDVAKIELEFAKYERKAEENHKAAMEAISSMWDDVKQIQIDIAKM